MLHAGLPGCTENIPGEGGAPAVTSMPVGAVEPAGDEPSGQVGMRRRVRRTERAARGPRCRVTEKGNGRGIKERLEAGGRSSPASAAFSQSIAWSPRKGNTSA